MCLRPIAIGLSPNTQKDDILLALKNLFQPWNWKKGQEISKVEEWFEKRYANYRAFSFNSGRSALYFLLKQLGIQKGDEVIVQAFTCVAAIEPLIWVGAKPVFADIDQTLNLHPKGVERKITPKTKAIIAQHTCGVPAQVEEIIKIAKENKLFLIEDCAHALGATYKGKPVGSFGDASFFSFGRDKIISSVFGGLALINEKLTIKNEHSLTKLKKESQSLKFPNNLWVMQQIFHPILFSLILPLYNFLGLGKFLLFIFQKMQLLSKPVYYQEFEGKRPDIFPRKLPNALAKLALHQLNKLEKYNEMRKKIAGQYKLFSKIDYDSGSVFLRFPLMTENAESIYDKAKSKKIILGRWYSNIIDPKGVDIVKIGYELGSCPKAEEAAKKIINLPTYPTLGERQVSQLVTFLKNEINN